MDPGGGRKFWLEEEGPIQHVDVFAMAGDIVVGLVWKLMRPSC